jgi:ABC-2 type transport system ATP-binding protein
LNSQPGQADDLSVVGLVSASKTYRRVRALHEVSCSFERGTTVLLGRNGAGKSTLCRLVSGIESPTEGVITRGGRDIRAVTTRHEHLRRSGWLPQAFAAPGDMTVAQYVAYAGWLKGLDGDVLHMSVQAALDRSNLTSLRKRRIRELSGGMFRRMGIAQAIVNRPDFLILDEPTVGLDPEQRGDFHLLLRDVAQDCAVLLSTHLLEDVAAVGDRVLVLDEGQLRFDGSVEDLAALSFLETESERLRAGFMSLLGHEAEG